MRARREHSGTRAGRSWTKFTKTENYARIYLAARSAALCQTGAERRGRRRVAGRGAGVCACARPHGAPARHVPPVARRRRRHRGWTQDGVRGVSAAAGGAPLELLRRRRRTTLRTRHAHRNARGGVHVRDHVGRRDARAERGVRTRRPARLPVHQQPAARRRRGDGRAVLVGRVRRGRVRRARGAALPGRARARARRARAHEPAQQPRRPQDGEGAGAARVQVPRRVGLVRRAHVLARAAALPRRRRRAAHALRARAARGAAPRAPRARAQTKAEPGRGAGAAQVGPGVLGAVALLLRARRRGRLFRHACTNMQQDIPRRGRVRVVVLRARLQHGAALGGDQVPLPLPLVLPRLLRHLPGAHRDAHLQLTALQHYTTCDTTSLAHRLISVTAERAVQTRVIVLCIAITV